MLKLVRVCVWFCVCYASCYMLLLNLLLCYIKLHFVISCYTLCYEVLLCFAVACYVMLGHGTFRSVRFHFTKFRYFMLCYVLLLPCPAPPRPAPPHPTPPRPEMNQHLQEAAAKSLCEHSWQDNKNVLLDRFKPIQQDVTIPWTPHIFLLRDTDPLHVRGNAANLEGRTIRFFYRSENFFCFVLQIGCIPMMCKVYRR